MQRKHGAAFVVRAFITLCSLVVHPPPPLHRLLVGVFFFGVEWMVLEPFHWPLEAHRLSSTAS